MASTPGPRKGAADALTAAVEADMAMIDELLTRVRADLQTLERWGAPMTLAPEWRNRLGLPPEEAAVSESRPKAMRSAISARNKLMHGALVLGSNHDLRDALLSYAFQTVSTQEDDARRQALRSLADSREASAAVVRDMQEHQTELSSIDYVVKVLSARPETVMEVGEIAVAMREAGWETRGDVGNVTVAALGKAVDRYAPMRRVGRGRYMWTEKPGELDLSIPEFSLAERPSEQETEVSRS